MAFAQEFVPGFSATTFRGCTLVNYTAETQTGGQPHPFARRFQADVANGAAVAHSLAALKVKRYRPDIVIAHAGWGEALYVKDVFPDVPVLLYCEFFYQPVGADLDFDPRRPVSLDERFRVRSLNAAQLMQLAAADLAVSPTAWQRSLFPLEFQSKIRQIHEGVDLKEFRPSRQENFDLLDGRSLEREDEVVTYVARSLEPYRGFDQFMQAIELVQQRRPRTHFLIAGGEDVTYSPRLKSGESYRAAVSALVKIDPLRTHFLGWLDNEAYRRLLRVSSVHAYLTVPFVLSWSLIEAMSTGCVVVASATPPVKEVIHHENNGLLCDFFAPEQFADAICSVLEHPNRMRRLGEQARRDVAHHFNKDTQVSRYLDLIGCLTGVRVKGPRGPA